MMARNYVFCRIDKFSPEAWRRGKRSNFSKKYILNKTIIWHTRVSIID